MAKLRHTLGALLLSAIMLTACSGALSQTPDPHDTAQDLATSLTEGTHGRDDVDAALESVADHLREVSVVEVTETPDTDPAAAVATLHWVWEPAPGQRWEYDADANLTRDGETWAVSWDPTLVHPDLGAGQSLEMSSVAPVRGDIVGAGGAPLVTLREVTRFGIARDRVPTAKAPASARRLAALLDIDADAFAARVKSAGERAFVQGIVLRNSEVPDRVLTGLNDIPGAFAVQDRIPLGPTPDFAEPILGTVGEVTAEMIEKDESLQAGDVRGLSGLEARYDDQLVGTPGWRVRAVGSDTVEDTTLGEGDAIEGDDLIVSLDQRLQTAAERALADVTPASALVAIRPSDGAILAAANGPGAEGINVATYGQTAPGSTFKVVSALALLRAGLKPSSPVACPPSTVVDGKRFENYDDYPSAALGRITLADALMHSCNTAFIDHAADLGDGQLAAAAASLGVSVDHDLGFPAYFGQVPPPASDTEAAADLIGQGGVLASPMAMAVVMASVQRGETVVPWLVDEVRSGTGDAPALEPGEAEQLRSMLRGVVTGGSGAGLADVPGPPVLAKTGTAEFDRDGRRLLHAWMVAAQGDLAVAVYVEEGASGSRTAGPVLERFLRGAR